MIAALVQSVATAAGWVHSFPVKAPTQIEVWGNNQVAVDDFGVATSVQRYLLTHDPIGRRGLLVVRTDHPDGHFVINRPDTLNQGLAHVAARGSRTFMVQNAIRTGSPETRCFLAEISAQGVLHEIELSAGFEQHCVHIAANDSVLYVLTQSGRLFVLDFAGQVLATFELGGSNIGDQLAVVAGNGDLLLYWQGALVPHGYKVGRISPSAGLLWEQAVPIVGSQGVVLGEGPNGETILVDLDQDQLTRRTWGIDGEPGQVQTQNRIGTGLYRLACLVGADLFTAEFASGTVTIRRYGPSHPGVAVLGFPQQVDSGSGDMACTPGRIGLLSRGDRGYAMAHVRPDGGQPVVVHHPDNLPFGFWAQNASRIAALTSLSPGSLVAEARLSVFDDAGLLLQHAEAGELPGEPMAMLLKGSGVASASFATWMHGVVSIHDVSESGLRWSRIAGWDYSGHEADLQPAFDMVRHDDGRVDALIDEYGLHLVRLDAQGVQTARRPLDSLPGFGAVSELKVLPDGRLLALAGMYPYLIDGENVLQGDRLALALGGSSPDDIRFIGYQPESDFEPGPPAMTYYGRFSPQLQMIPGTGVVYDPPTFRNWDIHANGTADRYVAYDQSSVRVTRIGPSGAPIFDLTHPVPSARSELLLGAAHPNFGIVLALVPPGFAPDETLVTAFDATGAIAWQRHLPFAVDSLAIGESGSVGAIGHAGAGRHLRLLHPDGSDWYREDCMDRRTCARAPLAITSSGHRWFAAGSSDPEPGSSVRRAYVQEIDQPLFEDGFEQGPGG